MALKITINGLPGCANARAFVVAKPKTRADFDQVVEALGGLRNFRVGYGSESLIYEADEGATYLDLQPPVEHPNPRPKGHPLIRELGEAIKEAEAEQT